MYEHENCDEKVKEVLQLSAHLSYPDLDFIIVQTHFSTYYDLRCRFFLAFVSLVPFIDERCNNSRSHSGRKNVQIRFFPQMASHSCDLLDLLTSSRREQDF